MKSIIDNIEQLLKQENPFVAYKKPDDNLINLMVQQDHSLYFLNNYTQKGFVFAPFDNSESTVLFPFDKCKLYTEPISEIESILIPEKGKIDRIIPDKEVESNHMELVQKGINFLRKEKVFKVVLSRKEEVSFDRIRKSELFNRLIHLYPLAFVSLFYHPKVGLWMGATPETLISVKNNKFKTMALAGTQSYDGNIFVNWGEKEKQEQQFVTDFIKMQLKDFDLEITEPFTKKAGNLLHICTEIKGVLASNDQFKILIDKLHPTPAVCGLPKEKAKLFILKNENYKREFYTGFLGELHINNASNLFVNLRCMQIEGQKANLYIGGGITLGSDPKSEWEETVSKSEVMKCILF